MVYLDGFVADFMNIMERYLVADKKGQQVANPASNSPSLPSI